MTQWARVHAGTQPASQILHGTVQLQLPNAPGTFQVRLVTRRTQVAAASASFAVAAASASFAVAAAPAASKTTGLSRKPTVQAPPVISAAAAAVLQGRRQQQEAAVLAAEREAAVGAAVEEGTVTSHAASQDMASVSQWSATSHASQHTAATSVFTYTLLRRFVAQGGGARASQGGGGLVVVRPPYALQTNEAVGSSTLFVTLPAAAQGWSLSPPQAHISPSGFASLAVSATQTPGNKTLLLLWEAAMQHDIEPSKCAVSVAGSTLVWRLVHRSRPRRAMHLQLEKPPTAALRGEAAALIAAPGALRCAMCDAALSQVRGAARAPSASWSAWMEHWLCHTEERGHLLPKHEITPQAHQALVTADEFVLHPTALVPGCVFLLPSRQRTSVSQLQYETRSTAARAQTSKQETLPDVVTCAVHCTRCRVVLGETVAVASMLGRGPTGLAAAFPTAFSTGETDTEPNAVQPAVQLMKAECTLLQSTPAEDVEAGVARGSVFSSYEWYLAQVAAVPAVQRDLCAPYSWATLLVRRALEDSTASGRYRTLLHCAPDAAGSCATLELRLQSWAASGAAAAAPVAFSVLDKGRFLRMEPSIAPASQRLVRELYGVDGGAAVEGSSSSRRLETMSRLCTFKWRRSASSSAPSVDDNTAVLQVAAHVLHSVAAELQALQAATPQQGVGTGWGIVWVPVKPIEGGGV